MDIANASGGRVAGSAPGEGRYAGEGGAVAAARDAMGHGAEGLSWPDVEPDPDAVPPLPALVVNALLGGTHNFDVDRDMAACTRMVWPGYETLMRAQSAFATRVVQWLTGQGITQFLDLGCGLPVIGAVHDIAGPHAKVVYADVDPLVVSFARDVLADRPHVIVRQGDLRKPAGILYAEEVMQLLNFDEPIGVLLTGVLPYLPDNDHPAQILAQIRDAVGPGSYLALSHLAPVAEIARKQQRLQSIYNDAQAPLQYRTAEQIAEFLTEWELVEPGIVPVTDWHPEPDANSEPPTTASLLGAVARAL